MEKKRVASRLAANKDGTKEGLPNMQKRSGEITIRIESKWGWDSAASPLEP